MKFFLSFFVILQLTKNAHILNIERDLGLDDDKNKSQNDQTQQSKEQVDQNQQAKDQTNQTQEVQDSIIQKQREQVTDDENNNSIQVQEYQDSSVVKNTCDLQFTGIFTKGQGQVIPEVGIQITDAITELCPGLVVSCCSSEDIQTNFQRVESGLKAFEENMENLTKVTNFITQIKEHDLENFLKNHEKNFYQCIELGDKDVQGQRFRDLIADTQKLVDSFEFRYKSYIRKVFISQYKLQCGICDISLQNEFLVTKLPDRQFYNVVVKVPDQINAYFETMAQYSEIYNLEILVQLMGCITRNGKGKKVETLKYGEQNFKKVLKNYRPETVESDQDALTLFSQEGIPGGQIDINYAVLLSQMKYLFYGEQSDKIQQEALTFWVPLENKKGEKPFNLESVQLSTHSEGYDETKIRLNLESSYLKNLFEKTQIMNIKITKLFYSQQNILIIYW